MTFTDDFNANDIPHSYHAVEATHDQITALISQFLPGATIYSNGDQWIIETHIGEVRKPDDSWIDTPAHEAYKEYEGSYGNTLERWAYKNIGSSRSLREIAHEYNRDYALRQESYQRRLQREETLLSKALELGFVDEVQAYKSAKATHDHLLTLQEVAKTHELEVPWA